MNLIELDLLDMNNIAKASSTKAKNVSGRNNQKIWSNKINA